VKILSTALFNLVYDKPHVGFGLIGGGALAGLLTLLQVLTPIIGFVAAVIGLIAGIYTLKSARRKWKHPEQDK